jgi:hypothetical protein
MLVTPEYNLPGVILPDAKEQRRAVRQRAGVRWRQRQLLRGCSRRSGVLRAPQEDEGKAMLVEHFSNMLQAKKVGARPQRLPGPAAAAPPPPLIAPSLSAPLQPLADGGACLPRACARCRLHATGSPQAAPPPLLPTAALQIPFCRLLRCRSPSADCCPLLQIPFKLEMLHYSTDDDSIGSMICKRAEHLNAAAVVMARHNQGRLKELFLGSVTNYCLHNLRAPLVIMHCEDDS